MHQKSQLIETTKTLIDIPSVSLNEAAIMEFIKTQLPSSLVTSFETEGVLFLHTPRRANTPFVVFTGHTDTVPINNNFPSRIEDDVIYGCGSADMKGGLAVMLQLATQVAANSPQNTDVGFLFFAQEELPSEHNLLHPAIEQSDAIRQTDLAILMEPTNNVIQAGCLGNINLRVTTRGIAAHTARPWTGRNAAHNLIELLQGTATAKPNEVIIDNLMFAEVASVTRLTAGTAGNVLRDQATAEINIRYAPSRERQEVEKHWVQLFTRENIDVEIIGSSPPAKVVVHHPLVERLHSAKEIKIEAKQAWTNAADFSDFGIAAINYGPGDPQFAHRQDEQITTQALLKCYESLEQFLYEN